MKNTKKGFTLIELLVVIAIIGILSAVVLASLNTARAKGADASVKSNLANARAEAELFYDSNGNNYGTAGAGTGVCASTGTNVIGDSVQAALSASGSTAAVSTACFVSTAGAGWAASVPLKSTNVVNGGSGTDYYCVDSTGQATTTDAIGITSGDVVCG